MSTPKAKTNGQWQHIHVSNDEITAAVSAAVAQMQANYDELNIGKIFAFGGSVESIPPKHVPCFGQNLHMNQYPALFDAICPVVGGGLASFTYGVNGSNRVTTPEPHGLVVGDGFITQLSDLSLMGAMRYVKEVVSPTEFNWVNTRTVNANTGQLTFSSDAYLMPSSTNQIRKAPHGHSGPGNYFKAPDRRGVVAIGRDNMGGTDAGRIGWANVTGIIAGVPTSDHTHTIDSAVSRAALGASASDAGNLSYVASTVVGGQYATVGAYGFGHGGVQTHSRGFNHHTPIYGSTHGASNVNNMQPSTIAEFIIYTGVE